MKVFWAAGARASISAVGAAITTVRMVATKAQKRTRRRARVDPAIARWDELQRGGLQLGSARKFVHRQ